MSLKHNRWQKDITPDGEVYMPETVDITDVPGAGYPPLAKGHGSRSLGVGTDGTSFPWANEHQTMERLIQGWVLASMFRDRGITPTQLAEYMNVSRQAVNYMITNLDRGNNMLRLEQALTEMTDAKGGVYRAAEYSEYEADQAQERLKQWLEK